MSTVFHPLAGTSNELAKGALTLLGEPGRVCEMKLHNRWKLAHGLTLLLLALTGCRSKEIPPLPPELGHERRAVEFSQVKPLLTARCMACHSCLESPCQLNMQSWEGLRRGAFHQNVYDGARAKAVEPTRMFEDAQSEREWRGKGFVDVLEGQDDSLLVSVLRLSQLRTESPKTPARESLICPMNKAELSTSSSKVAELAMPYGFPSLTLGEQHLIADWVANGAPGEANLPLSTDSLPAEIRAQLIPWVEYLNAPDLRSRIVARYLFEHLYLAHLYFKEAPRVFLKLVRSSTPCEEGVHPLATRRPNDDPGRSRWFYCFYRDPAVVVYKNHLPYEISTQKLAWLKQNFAHPSWTPKAFPSYSPEVAGNPLRAFAEIPVVARHRFLLEDANYEVMTFIKGPVCNGSFAVNAIQEQFYVFFTNPETDLMVTDPAYAQAIAGELILPGSLGKNLGWGDVLSKYREILRYRTKARENLTEHLAKKFPQGLGLGDIWDGGGVNDNAVLTVFRHDDNAKVVKGPKGDTPKTAFVLDYSTFERLVYNLAINFDVFENVTHQLLTRLYMDILRMDAEDNFLQYLPEPDRTDVKRDWYQGMLTRWKLDLMDETKFAPIPAKIQFSDRPDKKNQLIQKILFERMNAKVRGPDDRLNWKTLKSTKGSDSVEVQLRRLASVPANKKTSPFPNFFPELSVLVVHDSVSGTRVFSVLRNREHQNVSWVLNEKSRLRLEQDTLTILPGVMGAYPNRFFVVESSALETMVEQILALKSAGEFQTFAKAFAVDRMDPRVWSVYDDLNGELLRLEPIEAGLLDLSRYSIH